MDHTQAHLCVTLPNRAKGLPGPRLPQAHLLRRYGRSCSRRALENCHHALRLLKHPVTA